MKARPSVLEEAGQVINGDRKEGQRFIRHLEQATKTVAKWPKWKRDVLK